MERGVGCHLSIAHVNIRSLNTGFDEFSAIVKDFDFDIIGVTETWLHPSTSSDHYAVPGYTILRQDRQKNSENVFHDVTGGGVAIYIKSCLNFEQYTLRETIDPDVEYICVIVKVKGTRVGLCVGYRPPNVRYTSYSTLFHSLFVSLAVEVNTVVFVGDNNIDLLSKSPEAGYLRRLIKDSNSVQLINEPTRVATNSTTLIDHIIVDKSAEIERCGVIDTSSIKDRRGVNITDHKLIYCNLVCRKEKKKQKMIRYSDFSHFNVNDAIAKIREVDWNSATQMKGVDDIEMFISSQIKSIYDEQAPTVCKRVTKKKSPWRTDEIKALTMQKRKLRNKFWKSNSADDWERYKEVRNELNLLVWRAKKSYFNDKLSSTKNPKDFWNCLKQCDILQQPETKVVPNLKLDDINKYFADMGTSCEANQQVIDMFQTTVREINAEKFVFKAVTEKEVITSMNEIKSRAIGVDSISIQMVKAVSPFALEAITHLINESLITGVFPQKWKASIVHPLPKVTAPKSVQQLRPISILPAISKILEKIVVKQITDYLETKKILPETQSGFRKCHSTCTAMVNLSSDLIDTKDEGKGSFLITLDFSQAFDSLSHEMELAKMHYYNFSDMVVQWVKSYLEGREQVTRMDNERSSPLTKDRGVPQGSCLGPILFNLYTSDLPLCVRHCKVHMYADDCQLHLTYAPGLRETAVEQVNFDLENIRKWSLDNGLKLNISKCAVLHIAPNNAVQDPGDVGIEIDGQRLAVCDRVKVLGVILDNNLTFSDHVSHVIQRAMGRLRGLYRFRSMLPESAKLRIMQSLVLSVFYYCYPAYGNSISKEDKIKIQRMQNTAVRFIFCLNKYDHVTAHREAAKLVPMEDTCGILTNCMIHKVLLVREPQYLCDKLQYREEVSQRSTRQTGKLHFPRVRLELGRRSFSYFGPSMYNDLPESVIACRSLGTFKSRLKNRAYT